MKTRFLFPYWCKYLGIALIIIHIPIVLLQKVHMDGSQGKSADFFSDGHLFFITTTLLVAIGLFLIAFSKEKIEDELVSQLRLDSLQWAIYLNYLLLVISLILSDDTQHILILNMWVPMLFLIIRFRWKMFQNTRVIKPE